MNPPGCAGYNGPVMAKKRVMVAMSGGVDSTIAAALLLEAGYEVVGATLRLWTECEADSMAAPRSCCSLADLQDASEAASHLGIEHTVLDMRAEFRERVVEAFVDSYRNGLTPNPCIACNRHMKFELLLHAARRLGMDFLATGHYARVSEETGRFRLRSARDMDKDQSYVLYMLGPETLPALLLPNGDWTKVELRRRAEDLGLHVADKPDSQEVCFLAARDYRDFLRERIPEAFRPGPILDMHGRRLGEHSGIAAYTVGQRRGLGVSAPHPLFVAAVDATSNTVVVGRRDEASTRHLIAGEASWVAGEPPAAEFRAEVKSRYRMRALPATVRVTGAAGFQVDFDRPAWAVAPGQAAVVYNGEEVLGGGTILRGTLG